MAVGSGAHPRRRILETNAPNSKGQKNDSTVMLLPRMKTDFLSPENSKMGVWYHEFPLY